MYLILKDEMGLVAPVKYRRPTEKYQIRNI